MAIDERDVRAPSSPLPPDAERSERVGRAVAFALALLLPLAAHLWLGAKHLNVSDEGFLWYGVERTRAGEVPMRDFQAYDPGRYWWCAAWTPLLGDGIRGLRAALALFQGLGLLCALLVARRVVRSARAQLPWQLFVGLLVLSCAFPRHKAFEPAFGAIAAWAGVCLLERPSVARHLVAGLVVGLAGVFGRNLGLYCGLALGALALISAAKRREAGHARRFGILALGVALGYAPMVWMFASVSGFAAAFLDSLRLILEHGANISRPWPWPWRVETAGLAPRAAFREWAVAAAFLAPVLALPLWLLALARTRAQELAGRAACLAPAVVGLFFLHHATVNSGAWHLAQCSTPLVLAGLATPLLFRATFARVAAAAWSALALLVSAFAGSSSPELTQTLGERLVVTRVGRETLALQPRHASYLTGIEGALRATVGDEDVFLAPNIPVFYCLLAKRSPSWWLFFFWDATLDEDEALLAELEASGVRWALVFESPRGEQERRFSATHPRTWSALQRWRRVRAPGLPGDFVLLRKE